jgi:hypothetical protein
MVYFWAAGVSPVAQFEPSKRAISKTSIVLKRGFLNRRVFWLSESVPVVVTAKQKPGLRQTLIRGYNAI